MGLFGEMDATEVPDNPFYVAPDTYFCTLVEAKVVESEKNGKTGLAFKWVINEEDSEYNNNNIQDWNNIYPGIAADEVTPDIRKDNARLKQRLLQMGIPEEEMNSLLDNLEEVVGLQAYVTVKETPDKHDPDKKYTNVTKVRIDE